MSNKKKQTVQLEFGIRNGKVISINELSVEEKGDKCNCYCPVCNEPLRAKLGDMNQWHFAHTGNHKCNIAIVQQTALHRLAKEIIEDKKELLFPGIIVKRSDFIDNSLDPRVQAKLPSSFEYRKTTIPKFDSVSLEKKLSDIIPDIVVSAKGHPCLIEIAVTHFVDDKKERKIKELGIPLLEIDLSDIYNTEFSREELADLVLYNSNNRKWIFNPLYDEAKKRAKDEYSDLIDSATKEIEEEDKRISVENERKQKKRKVGEGKIKEIFKPENYKQAVLSLQNSNAVAMHLKKLHLKSDINALPFFLNIPITGEMIFQCDRRIWQSTLFYKFIHNRREEDNLPPTVHLIKVHSWLKNHNNYFKIDWQLAYKTEVEIESKKTSVTLLNDVVSTFFNHLTYLGFLQPPFFQEYLVNQAYSLTPPNKEHANILLDALKKVDWYSPSVNTQLLQAIEPRLSTKTVPRSHIPEVNFDFDIGLKDVIDSDFNGDEHILDRFGCRWLFCTDCEKIFPSQQMARYGGTGSINKGICSKCNSKLNRQK